MNPFCVNKYVMYSWREIEEYFIRDKYMTAPEAKNFGIVDEILGDVSDVVKVSSGSFHVDTYGDLNVLKFGQSE